MFSGRERRRLESGNPLVVLLMCQRHDWFERQRIWRRMPGSTLVQDGIQFTLNPNVPSDVCLVLNQLPSDVTAVTNKRNVWRWDLESWAEEPKKHSFTKIFSNFSKDPKAIPAPPILDWWVDKSFDELDHLQPPKKNRSVSCIASAKSGGSHRLRFDFVDLLGKHIPEVEVFGRGRPVELRDKWDGLETFRFTLALENKSQSDYWTEKLADSFLAYCVPFYWGAPNLQKYFPPDSFIWLPIDKPDRALEIIRDQNHPQNYEARLSAVSEARSRILHDYSLFASIRREISSQGIVANKQLRRSTTIRGLRRNRSSESLLPRLAQAKREFFQQIHQKPNL